MVIKGSNEISINVLMKDPLSSLFESNTVFSHAFVRDQMPDCLSYAADSLQIISRYTQSF